MALSPQEHPRTRLGELPGAARRSRRRRALAVALLTLVGGLAVSGPDPRVTVEGTTHAVRLLRALPPHPLPAPATPPSAPTTAPSAATTPPGDTPVPDPIPSPVLRLPGPVPATGRGTFQYGGSRGELLGRSGMLRRYRVAVEAGAGENVEEFATAVDRTLGNPASWIGSGQLRLQRVPASAPYDFTVYLATADTARLLCATGGVDIMVDTRPYTSCRAPGRVIINLDRWRLSVEHFVAAQVPLDTYRQYVIDHEVGHELGYGHESCPGKGRPAPVMMQQTLFLNGCVANPWPYLSGKRYVGPPV